MNAVTETVAAEPVSGVEIFVPLAKLKKSPRNARKVPHGEAAIEALAASIQHKGLIQNLVIEPEVKEDGTPTGYYLVTAGEGRRLAMLLRAKRKQIKKSEPVRCWLDTANDPSEISLDENVTRTPMHPADQFERLAELSNEKGWGAQEIGARFGVSASVVKQRLRLGAVSPKLLQVYREDGLTLDQLMAFAITEDHARQEQVFENLHHNREPWIIRRDMTAGNVPADDRRAVFVGADAYIEAGGARWTRAPTISSRKGWPAASASGRCSSAGCSKRSASASWTRLARRSRARPASPIAPPCPAKRSPASCASVLRSPPAASP